MFKYLSLIRIEEWLAVILALAFSFFSIFVYHYNFFVSRTVYLMVKYFTFGDPFYGVFFAFIWLFFLFKLYIYLPALFRKILFDRQSFSLSDLKPLSLFTAGYFRVFLPFIIVSVSAFQLLSGISYYARYETEDLWFFQLDQYLFGGQAFLYLPSVFSSFLSAKLMSVVYFSLPIFMSASLIALFLRKDNFLFRQAIVSYIVSLAIAFPMFYAVPCQDPGNYFLRNIRGHSFSPQINATLKQYNPGQFASQYIQQIAEAETYEEADNTVPISCFPSMHAVWTFFVVYFAARLWRRTLWFTLPWFFLLLAGGLYLAQHYAVDYIAGIAVAAFSVLAANKIIKWDIGRNQNKSVLTSI